jgi:Lrp/AsnC family transcriptional regulator, leucine-responsive regulatory protein
VSKKRAPATAVEIDDLDRKILARYQGDTRVSAERIGEEVGLSTAAVHRRLKRLREAGVIEAEVALLNPDAIGLPLTCLVAVDIDRERTSDVERFTERMLACELVQQCYYVTGQADFFLVVATADMAAYEAFTREHLMSDANVRSFTTHVVMRRIKGR